MTPTQTRLLALIARNSGALQYWDAFNEFYAPSMPEGLALHNFKRTVDRLLALKVCGIDDSGYFVELGGAR